MIRLGNREWGIGNRKRGLSGFSSNFDSSVSFDGNTTCPHTTTLFPIPYSPFPIHLQWFSDNAEEEGRTEPPTEHKLRRLREEGQVPKSQEISGAITLFFPALLLLFLAPYMLSTCMEMFRFFFSRAAEIDPVSSGQVAGIFFTYLAKLAAPILIVAVFSAIFSNVIQVGFLFTTKPLTPNFSRILPKFGQFFKRIFSIDGLFNLIKSIIKMAIIGGIAYNVISGDFNKLKNLQTASLWNGLTLIASLAIRILIICAVLLIILSIPDFMFQRWRFRQRNKMSKQEMKEEMKMYEGDPQIRNRIRGRFRELLKHNIAQTVPNADVVITNPTHFAIALEYHQETMPGPMVTAKGADEAAARIRKIAEEAGVPLVENKPVARELYKITEEGDFIPEEYYSIVATIFRKVMDINEFRRKAKAQAAAQAAQTAASTAAYTGVYGAGEEASA